MKKINLKFLIRRKFIRISIIILLVGANITFYMLQKEEKNLRMLIQKQLVMAHKKLMETIGAKKQVKVELSAEKNRSNVLRIELDQKKRQLKFTLNQLEKEIASRRQAEVQLIRTLEERKLLESKVRKFTKASKVIELEKIVVERTAESVGKVLEINKEHSFVVVDLGRRNYLKIGDVLSIYRDDEIIGKARVEKVGEELCAAAILSNSKSVEFKEDDMVKLWK